MTYTELILTGAHWRNYLHLSVLQTKAGESCSFHSDTKYKRALSQSNRLYGSSSTPKRISEACLSYGVQPMSNGLTGTIVDFRGRLTKKRTVVLLHSLIPSWGSKTTRQRPATHLCKCNTYCVVRIRYTTLFVAQNSTLQPSYQLPTNMDTRSKLLEAQTKKKLLVYGLRHRGWKIPLCKPWFNPHRRGLDHGPTKELSIMMKWERKQLRPWTRQGTIPCRYLFVSIW